MAITETRQLPPKFIEQLGTDLGTQLIAQSGRPTVAPGIAGLSQLTGESAEDFAARQQAAQEFDIRKQSIAGLAPTVAGQTALQTEAQRLAEAQAGQSGIASFQPFLQTKLKNRVSRYQTKKFVITMSDEIPGFIFKIETFIKDLEDPDDMVIERLQFQGIRTNNQLREEYKKRKDES